MSPVVNYFVDCSQALGLESGKISDSQLKASHHFLSFNPSKGRLNNERAWCTNRIDEYFEIDLLKVRHVSALATQGYKGLFHNYVKTYEIQYSYDGVKWFAYRKDKNGEKKVLNI